MFAKTAKSLPDVKVDKKIPEKWNWIFASRVGKTFLLVIFLKACSSAGSGDFWKYAYNKSSSGIYKINKNL